MNPLRVRLLPAHLDVPYTVVKRAPPADKTGLFVRLHTNQTVAEVFLQHPEHQAHLRFDIGAVLCRFNDEMLYVDGTMAVAEGDGLPERHPVPPGFHVGEWIETRLMVVLGLARDLA